LTARHPETRRIVTTAWERGGGEGQPAAVFTLEGEVGLVEEVEVGERLSIIKSKVVCK